MVNADFISKGAAQVGHALGLFPCSFGLFTLMMWVASFRTNLVVTVALFLFALGAGNCGANTDLVHLSGHLGLVTAAPVGYPTCAEICEAAYGRSIRPVWPLAKH